MNIDKNSQSSNDEYTDLGYKSLDGLLGYAIITVIIAAGAVALIIFDKGTSYTLIAVLMALACLALIYMMVSALVLPGVIIRYCADGIVLFNSRKPKHIKWQDIESIDIIENRKMIKNNGCGVIVLNAGTKKEVRISWLKDVSAIRSALVELHEKYTYNIGESNEGQIEEA